MPANRMIAVFLLLSMFATFGFGLGAPLLAFQVPKKAGTPQDEGPEPVFLRPPRELSRPLARAKVAIEKGEFRDAVRLLGDTLSQSQTEDYLVPVSDSSRVVVSLRGEAQRLLGTIPKKYRDSYELRFGIEAKQILQSAIDAGDYDQLAQIIRKYFHTEAGYMATMLLGHHHLDEGRPIAAAFCFQRITDSEDARKIHDPEASVLLATCWTLGGAGDRAEQTLVELKKRRPGRTIKFQGRDIKWFADDAKAADWLAALIGETPLMSNQLVNEWLVFRGNAARNAESGSGFPLKYARWRVPTINNPEHELVVKEIRDELLLGNSSCVPCLQPLAVGETILMKSAEKLIGVDFKTGKRVWVYPEDFFFSEDEEVEEQVQATYARQNLIQRMWLDAVLGQISSDGELVFVVNEAGYAGGSSDPVVAANGQVLPNRLGATETNILQGVEIDRQGAVKWQVGGVNGWDEPQLAGSFFLGPPLPMHDELFVLHEQDTEIRLAVLDARTGKLNWSQQIANIESLDKIGRSATRRLAGASPSFSDGILICPTSATAIVAIDISTRSLVWGFQYQGVDPKAIRSIVNTDFDDAWRDSTITVSGGSVVITPVDDKKLYCLDLLTGTPRWSDGGQPIEIDREDSIFVGCVENDKIVLVGRNSIRAIDIHSGKQAWRVELGINGRPSGHGYLNHGHYFLPTTAQRIVKINLADGIVVDQVATRGVLGNLICYRGDVISHGVDWVSCYPQDEPIQRQITAAEALGPLSEAQQLQKAQLLSQKGETKLASQIVKSVHDQNPSPRSLELMLDLIIEWLQKDFDQAQPLAKEFHTELLERRQFEYVDAKINGLLAVNDAVGALDTLLEISESTNQLLDLSAATATASAYRNVGDGQTSMRVDFIYRNRLRKLLDSTAPSSRRKWLDQVGELAMDAAPESQLRLMRLFNLFGAEVFDPEIQFVIVEHLIAEQRWLAAELVLARHFESTDRAIAARAEGLLARLLVDANLGDEAKRQHLRLASEFAEVECDQGKNGKQLYEAFLSTLPENTAADFDWPTTAPVLSEPGDQGVTQANPQSRMICRQQNSRSVNGLTFTMSTTGWALFVSDQYGAQLGQFSFRSPDSRGRFFVAQNAEGSYWIYGHLLVAGFGHELIAIDLFKLFRGEDALMWQTSLLPPSQLVSAGRNSYRQPFRPQMTGNVWGQRRVRLLHDNRLVGAVSSVGPNGVAAVREDQVVCLHPLTGERVWQRANFDRGSDLTGDSENICVVKPDTLEIDVVSIFDGSPLEQISIDSKLGKEWWKLQNVIVLHANDKKTMKLTGWDITNDREIWSRDFPNDTRADFNGASRAAFYQPDGHLELLDLATGETVYRNQLKFEFGKIHSIEFFETRDQYVIAFNKNQNFQSYYSVPGSNMSFQSMNYSRPLLNGYLFALDKEGKSHWSSPVRVEYFDTPLQLLWNVPVFVFNRIATRQGTRTIQTTAIDTRNGRQMFAVQEDENYSRMTNVRADRRNRSINILAGSKSFEVGFSKEPRPPGAPAQLTNQHVMGLNSSPLNLITTKPDNDEARAAIIAKIKEKRAAYLERQQEIRRLNDLQRDEEK